MRAAREAHFSGRTPAYVNEHRAQCKDGQWKRMLSRGIVISRDAQDGPLRMIGTHTDIWKARCNWAWPTAAPGWTPNNRRARFSPSSVSARSAARCRAAAWGWRSAADWRRPWAAPPACKAHPARVGVQPAPAA